ncbi:MAG: hypothetical protein M3N16_06175 [Actinomycetota bacterium]|nr:hypothetical protein [Actinomycetota bacterium]
MWRALGAWLAVDLALMALALVGVSSWDFETQDPPWGVMSWLLLLLSTAVLVLLLGVALVSAVRHLWRRSTHGPGRGRVSRGT